METDVQTPVADTPPEAPKPRIIRNREVDKAASALTNDHVLPIPPGKTLDWVQVEKYLALLTPAMWSHFMVYVYRVKPKIRRQLRDPNSPNYIDCLSEPFTLDYLISRHGGGKYQLQAVDTDKKDYGTNGFFKCLLEINDVQHPPILDYAELEIEARENKSYVTWLQNKGILGSDGKVIPPQPVTGPPSANGNMSAQDVLNILGYAQKMNSDQQAAFRAQFAPGPDSLSKSVGDILLEKMRQDDPREDWKMMMGFMDKLNEKNNKPDNTFAQILQLQQDQSARMMQMQSEERKTNLEYTKLLLSTQQQQANPTKSQFSEFREIIAFARELLGSAGGHGRRSGWDTGLEIARDVALPAIQSLGATITNIMALRNGQPPVAGAPGTPAHPAAFDPYANPAARSAYAQTLAHQPQPTPAPAPAPPPPPGPQPAAPGQPPPGDPGDAQNQLLGLFSQYGNLIIGHLNSGTPGYDFAAMITDLMGTATHAMIATQGEEMLWSTMMRIPEMAMFGEARLREFVHQFVNYQQFFDQQEEPEEEPVIEPEIVDMPKIYRPAPRPKAQPHA